MSTEIILTRNESRQIDSAAIDELGFTGTVLMENAARGAADVAQKHFPAPSAITILCGPGNNGGDGFALARQLACLDHQAEVWLLSGGRTLTDDARFNRDIWVNAGGRVCTVGKSEAIDESEAMQKLQQRLNDLDKHAVIFDCLLGTGISGPPREPFATAISAVNDSAAAVIAVDVPSGLDCDTGETPGEAICAKFTVTFVATKRGYRTSNGRRHTGEVHVAHIGLPGSWVTDWLARYRSSFPSSEDS